MSEEKKLNNEVEIEEEDFDTAEAVKREKKAKKEKAPKAKKERKPKKLKNQAFLKKGSYSLAITAAVIIGAVIINVLTAALADRFVLEFDMSKNKDNSISEENIDYIKGIEDEVKVVICADEDGFVNNMGYYAQQYHGVYDDNAVSYYEQTATLIDNYANYNKKVKVEYVDPYSSEFSAIKSSYKTASLGYGDIIVSSGEGEKEKYKIIGFKDIYNLYEDQSYASYGMSFYTVSGNNIETALTSGISYVLTDEIKKVAVIAGHSSEQYYSTYATLLTNNNYDVTVLEDKIITKISDEFDTVAIVAPSTDFSGAELDAISEFLDNNGKLNKGLIVVADASNAYLTNLYDFLSQWGIVLEDGVVYETYDQYHAVEDNTTFISASTGKDDMLTDMQGFVTGNNVPMYSAFESQGGITVTPLTASSETTVVAPKGSSSGWAGADKVEAKSYNGALLSTKSTYNSDNELIASKVAVFSSTHFVVPLEEYAGASNQALTLAVTERATGADDSGIVFTSKYIENESFASEVTEGSAKTMRLIFMWIIPLLTIALSIFIFIRRKNA